MDLILRDNNLKAISIIDTYESLIWTDRYDSYGDFQICMPITKEVFDLMRMDYYLQNRDSEHVMIIESLEIKSDAEAGNLLTITGRSLESILNRRIVWGMKTLSGNLQDAIKSLLDDCIISPMDRNRQISNFIFEYSTDPAITELTIESQYTGDNLYDIIHNICSERNIGFKITLNDNNQFVFKFYAGVDRSYNQTSNPYVIFSPKFDNLSNSNYIESLSAMKTVALIGGEGEGSARKYVMIFNSKHDVMLFYSGLGRREIFVDARDLASQTDDGETISEWGYEEMLRQRGREKFEENAKLTSFEGEIQTTNMFKYGEDFFNGDIVQIANEYGHNSRVRIIEMVTSDNSSGYSVYPTFKTI